MRFIKMHGIGNDYVYVNAWQGQVADPARLAVKIADRHYGVGGDGLILVDKPEPGVEADVRMRMFNADGSESEMCGNGVRCVCKLAHDHGISTANPMRVQTGRGVLSLSYELDKQAKVAKVSVDMGEPILPAGEVPVLTTPDMLGQPMVNAIVPELWAAVPGGDAWKKRCELDERATCVSMGNPHVVFYCAHVDAVPLETVGPILERHAMFPRRINVHFVEPISRNEVKMRTWERGSGITLACGTGASAVCVAGVLSNRTARRINAQLPGGDLELDWRPPEAREAPNHLFMTGPAVEVFQGDWPDEA
ncbi:MAG: diaminopimelate epimerase [Phycisphaeraceae bacterium]|nr:diaminopimelate epimerase [Phycisphaeraceae bacterium]